MMKSHSSRPMLVTSLVMTAFVCRPAYADQQADATPQLKRLPSVAADLEQTNAVTADYQSSSQTEPLLLVSATGQTSPWDDQKAGASEADLYDSYQTTGQTNPLRRPSPSARPAPSEPKRIALFAEPNAENAEAKPVAQSDANRAKALALLEQPNNLAQGKAEVTQFEEPTPINLQSEAIGALQENATTNLEEIPPGEADYLGSNGGGLCADCCQPVCCCPKPCCPCYWVGGVEATFLVPDLDDSGVGYFLEDNIAAPPTSATMWSGDNADVDNMYVAPRLWLGVQKCNWGVVGRYWHLRANQEAYDPYTFPGGYHPGASSLGYFAYNQLDAYAVDLEGTYSFCCCCDAKNTLSFGARYAYAEHNMGLASTSEVNDGASGMGRVVGLSHATRMVNGTGITGGWNFRKPLFCCSCINLVAGVRGSVLWGCSHASAETSVDAHTTGGSGFSANSAVYTEDDTLFIGEAIGGLQWDYRVQCFPADAFFRIVAEYQYWDAGDGYAVASSTAGFGTSPNNAGGTSTALANAFEMDLYGISVATGFTW